MDQSETFSIRQMVEITGLSEFTIRGWENRYSAFDPQRSDTGRREYKKADVERALLLRELLKRGHKIGKIAQLNNQKLKVIFEEAESHKLASIIDGGSKLAIQALELLALQKWHKLKRLIRRIPSQNPVLITQDFFLPVLKLLASEVAAGAVSIPQEHIFSAFLKEKIYSALSELETKRESRALKKFQFVLAAPEGDFHDIGLLLAQLLIRAHGFNSVYLGPHTPARDLSVTALRLDASHLLIVSTVSKKDGARQELLSFVSDVQKRVGSGIQILIAGSQAPRTTPDPSSTILGLNTFTELETYLQKLGGRL